MESICLEILFIIEPISAQVVTEKTVFLSSDSWLPGTSLFPIGT